MGLIVPVTCIKLLYVRIKLSYEKFCAWYLLIYKVFLVFMTSETCVMRSPSLGDQHSVTPVAGADLYIYFCLLSRFLCPSF